MNEDQNEAPRAPEWRAPGEEQLETGAYHVWKPRPLLRSVHWKPVPEPARGAGAGSYDVFVDQRAFKAMHQHVWNAGAGEDPFGFLVGDLCEDPDTGRRYVIVSAAVPSKFGLAEGSSKQIPGEAMVAIQLEVDRRRGVLAGWYHRHRTGPAVLTPEDVATHEKHFGEPWNAAFLFVTNAAKPAGACFRRTHHGLAADVPLPFFEMVSNESLLAKGVRRSFLDWTNVETDDAIQQDPPPRPEPSEDQAQPEEAQAPEPEDILVVLPVPVEEPPGEEEGEGVAAADPIETEPEIAESLPEPVEESEPDEGIGSDLLDLPVAETLEDEAESAVVEDEPGALELDGEADELDVLPPFDIDDDEPVALSEVDAPEDELAGLLEVDVPEDDLAGLPEVDVPEDDLAGLPEVDVPEDDLAGLPEVDVPEDELEGLLEVDAPEDDLAGLPEVDVPEDDLEGLPEVDVPEDDLLDLPQPGWDEPPEPGDVGLPLAADADLETFVTQVEAPEPAPAPAADTEPDDVEPDWEDDEEERADDAAGVATLTEPEPATVEPTEPEPAIAEPTEAETADEPVTEAEPAHEPEPPAPEPAKPVRRAGGTNWRRVAMWLVPLLLVSAVAVSVGLFGLPVGGGPEPTQTVDEAAGPAAGDTEVPEGTPDGVVPPEDGGSGAEAPGDGAAAAADSTVPEATAEDLELLGDALLEAVSRYYGLTVAVDAGTATCAELQASYVEVEDRWISYNVLGRARFRGRLPDDLATRDERLYAGVQDVEREFTRSRCERP